jgi:hypothetical protein
MPEPSLPRGGSRRRPAAILLALLACAAFLLAGPPAHAVNQNQNPAHRIGTWNMNQGRGRWQAAFNLAGVNDFVALQETPSTPPSSAVLLPPAPGLPNDVRVYSWRQQGSTRGPQRFLITLDQPSRNLAVVTSWYPTWIDVTPGNYRSALVVGNADGTAFATVHAASGTGNDAGSLVRWVRDTAGALHGTHNWVVAGDFNRVPSSLPQLMANAGMRRGEYYIYDTGQTTQQRGNELDYMVSNIYTRTGWPGTRLGMNGSDHAQVQFGGTLRGGAGSPEFTMSGDSSRKLVGTASGQSNGTHLVIEDGSRQADLQDGTRPSDLWSLSAAATGGEGPGPHGLPMWRIVSAASGLARRDAGGSGGKCLDVDLGQNSVVAGRLNVWDCHAPNGSPDPGGPFRDTQDWELIHPSDVMPNQVVLRNAATDEDMNVLYDLTADGTPVIQWYDQSSADLVPANVTFHLHPLA